MSHEYFTIFSVVKEVAFGIGRVIRFDSFAAEHAPAIEMKKDFLLLGLELVKCNESHSIHVYHIFEPRSLPGKSRDSASCLEGVLRLKSFDCNSYGLLFVRFLYQLLSGWIRRQLSLFLLLLLFSQSVRLPVYFFLLRPQINR